MKSTNATSSVRRSSANRTPQLGQRSASAGTEVLHTGHSYSVASPSENSAPQPGHTVASAETSVSHTGQRNCSPRSAAASMAGLGFASAPSSADSGVSRATFLSVSKISRGASLPSMIEARISSMLRPSLTGISSGSVLVPMSNKVRSVWHEGHTRASASIGVSQTGQTFVSFAGVSRHLELVDTFLSGNCVQRLSGLSPENDKSSAQIITSKRLSEPCPRVMRIRRGHGVSQCNRRSGQSDSERHRPTEGHPRHRPARVDEDLVLLHAHVAVLERHRGVPPVHHPRRDGPVAPAEHGVPRRRALDEHADQRLHGPPGDRCGRRPGRPNGLPCLHRADDRSLPQGARSQVQAVRPRLSRRAILAHGEHDQHAEADVLLLQDAPRQRTHLPRGHGAGAERGESAPWKRGVSRRWHRGAGTGPVPREARAISPGREDAICRSLDGETRDRGPEGRAHRPRADLRGGREFFGGCHPPTAGASETLHRHTREPRKEKGPAPETPAACKEKEEKPKTHDAEQSGPEAALQG